MKRSHDLAEEDPCDDSLLLRVYLSWVGTVAAAVSSSGGPSAGHVSRLQDGAWQLAFAVQRGPTRRQRHFVTVDPDTTRTDRWGLVKLGPGVWDVAPSIYVEGQLHAFVTLLGVPEPAPWEPSAS